MLIDLWELLISFAAQTSVHVTSKKGVANQPSGTTSKFLTFVEMDSRR